MTFPRAGGRHSADARSRFLRLLSSPRRRLGYGALALSLAAGVGLPISVITSGSTPGSIALASSSGNLVVNPGFETGDTSGWRTNGADEVLSVVTAAHSGQYAGRLTTTDTTTGVFNDNPNTVSSTVAGATYAAQVWVRTTTPPLAGTLKLREVSSGTQVAGANSDFTLSDRKWHLVSVSLPAAGSGDSIDVNLDGYSMAKGKTLFADDFSMIASTTAPAPTTTSPAPAPTTSSPAPAPTATSSSPAPAPTTTSPAPAPTTTSPAPAPTTTSPAPSPTSSSSCSVNAILVPSCGAWWGVAPNPLNGESWDQALVNFEATIGRTVDIVHYYHRDTQLFPTATEIGRATQAGANRLLLENWKPENGNTWAQVAAGASDTVIDNEAAYIKSHFTRRFFLALHGEPERYVNATTGSGYTAADYAAMYRHVILRLRADGVTNIVSVLDLTGLPTWGSQSWFPQLYPGNDVVDWLAEDPYDIGPTGSWYDTNYDGLVNRTFPGYSFPGFNTWDNTSTGAKPIMIAEWGVDELSTDPTWKPNHFTDIVNRITTDMPNVKALVYWNSNTFNPVGTTRVDSSTASLTAYQKLGKLPYLNQPVPTN